VAALELLALNYLHHFVTMFKVQTVMVWGYRRVTHCIETGLILEDLSWLNCPPLMVPADGGNAMHETIMTLRH